jgi:hypothetical protein
MGGFRIHDIAGTDIKKLWFRGPLPDSFQLAVSIVHFLQIEIIGEAAARVSPESRTQYPAIPRRYPGVASYADIMKG